MNNSKQLVSEALSLEELKVGRVSSDYIITKYWILYIELPDSQDAIFSVVSYENFCKAIFIVDSTRTYQFHKEGIKISLNNIVQLEADSMIQQLQTLNLYETSSGGGYDSPTYFLELHTPNCISTLRITTFPNSQLLNLTRSFMQFANELNTQYMSEQITTFIKKWRRYEGY